MKSLLLFLAFIGLFCKVSAQQMPATLQNFKFYDTKNAAVTKSSLVANKPTVIMFFDPTCDHCQAQAKTFDDNIAQFKNAQFLFVTISDDKAAVDGFAAKYMPKYWANRANGPKMHFTIDNDFTFDKFFGESQIPTLIISNSAEKLAKRWEKIEKPIPVSEIVPFLK